MPVGYFFIILTVTEAAWDCFWDPPTFSKRGRDSQMSRSWLHLTMLVLDQKISYGPIEPVCVSYGPFEPVSVFSVSIEPLSRAESEKNCVFLHIHPEPMRKKISYGPIEPVCVSYGPFEPVSVFSVPI